MKKTTIYIPEEMALNVSAIAKQEGTSEATFIREAIADRLATRKRPRPSIIGSVAIEGVRGEDTEDILLKHWRPESE